MKRHLITAAALVLALAGCSQPQETDDAKPASTPEETQEGPTVYKPGAYEYDNGEGTVTFQIPATEADAPEIAEVEQLREALKAPKVAYIAGDIDNRNGTEQLDPYSVYLYDKDGKKYEFESASIYIGDNLSPNLTADDEYQYPDGSPMTEDQYDQLNSDSIDLYNSYLNQGDPGERNSTLWIYQGEAPDEFTNPSMEDGMEKYPLVPAGESTPSDTGGQAIAPPAATPEEPSDEPASARNTDAEIEQCEAADIETATSGDIQYCYMEYGISVGDPPATPDVAGPGGQL